jgi:hypothetical protein
MFRYYQSAEACYVYLSDVSNLTGFSSSRWFTRGWTLQELVAPRNVTFYTTEWQLLGSKSHLWSMIQSVTSIPKQILVTCDLAQVNVATKMSWAAQRQTTRVEDLAYCLMGIFGVHMPLLYGEGSHAFARLQQEIIKTSHDPSILLWGLQEKLKDFKMLDEYEVEGNVPTLHLFGHFATSPSDFTSTEHLVVLNDFPINADPIITGNGLRITLSVMKRNKFNFAILPCALKDEPECFIAIPLLHYRGNYYSRLRDVVLVHATWTDDFIPTSILIKQPPASTATCNKSNEFTLIRIPDEEVSTRKLPARTVRAKVPALILEDTYWLPHAHFDQRRSKVTLHEPRSGPHGILFLSESTSNRGRKFAIVLGSNLSSNSSDYVWVAFVRIEQPPRVEVVQPPRVEVVQPPSSPVKSTKRGLLGRWNPNPQVEQKAVHIGLPNTLPPKFLPATAERATKEQLIAGLVDGTAMRSILRPKSTIHEKGLCITDRKSGDGVLKRIGLSLEAHVNKDRANLVEDTTFIFIRTCQLQYGNSGKGDFVAPELPKWHYPKWWEIENQGPLVVRQHEQTGIFGRLKAPTTKEEPLRPYPARLLSHELVMPR